MTTQRAEVLLQVPYSVTTEGAAFPLQEEAGDGGPDPPESHIASNDSDSELEEAPDVLSPVSGGGLHGLSFLEMQDSAASVEDARDSSSEEPLGASTGEDGNWEGLSQCHSDQCTSVKLHGPGSSRDREPEFV